jgi:origin recognition complex subunit 2
VYEDDVDDADKAEDESLMTPGGRKTGLVGTPTKSARGTPRATPRKKAATPRKNPLLDIDPFAPGQASGAEGDVGFVRASKADQYFLAHSRASKTSGSSYSSLVRPLSQAEYERFAGSARSKGKSRATVAALLEDHAERYEQWEAEMDEGFNLLFYGFGSKRRLLNRFVSSRLSKKGHAVVVNGHFPGISIRDVLAQIEETVGIPLEIPTPVSAVTPLDKAAHRVYTYFLPEEAIPTKFYHTSRTSKAPLYMIIHNIDAPAFRTQRAISVLSLLACNPNIHIIASFDHAHTPLLFPASLNNTPPHHYNANSWTGHPPASRGFDWLYHNVTTYDDYDIELSYQRLSASTSLQLGTAGASAGGVSEEGALQILRSVPPMALRLLKLLIQRQVASLPPDIAAQAAFPANPIAPVCAVDNDLLQTQAREKFIAREEERYNALMGEFKDHGLVTEALQDEDGRQGRWVWIPLGKAALERVVAEMGNVEV